MTPAERSEAVALKEYVDQRLVDMDARIESDLRGRERAVELAERNLATRLDHLNEWRQQSLSERTTFATREMVDMLESRVRAMEQSAANYAGRFWAFGVGASVAGGVLGFLLQYGWK